MSKDAIDTLKAVLFLAFVFALASGVALFVLEFWAAYGLAVPLIGTLPAYRPENTIQMLTFTRPLGVVGAAWLVAASGALLVRSPYFDHMLQIFAKALSMIAAAYVGIILGHWAYLRMTRTGDLDPSVMTRLVIVTAILTLLAMFLRLESLRAIGWMRYVVIALAALFGPLLLVTGP